MIDESRQFEEVHPPLTIGSEPPEHSAPPLPPEQSDVGIALPVAIGLIVLVFLAIGMGTSAWLLVDRPASTQAPPSPLAFLDDPTPAPHLQYDPPIDLARLREKEQTLLHNYGWVDRQQNVVRIPIERAMQLVAERGLPATAAPSSEPSDPRQPATAEPEDSSPANDEAPAEPATDANTPPETSATEADSVGDESQTDAESRDPL